MTSITKILLITKLDILLFKKRGHLILLKKTSAETFRLHYLITKDQHRHLAERRRH